jgi:type IX secretion system PorP/SprF family membrane protein
MRKSLTYLILFLLPAIASGQLHHLSNQYIFNGLAINPAYAGSEDALSTTLMYRNQWSGFKGAPKTLTAALHAPLGKERIGMGLLVVNDKVGVNSETNILANYAYIIEMGEGKLSFGVALGITLIDIKWNQLDAGDINDMELPIEIEKLANPNFGAGMYYHNKQFYFGLSVPFFLSYSYNSTSKEIELHNDFDEYNYHITSGFKFRVNSNTELFPSFLIKYHPKNAFQADINAQLIFFERLWAGFTYRTLDACAVVTQLAITNQFRLAYSYDFNIGKIRQYYGGSHEVMLKYILDFKSRVVSPKRF